MTTVALYRSWDDLEELKEKWNLLLSRSSSDTVFLTWEWCSTWWKSYGANRPLFALGAWNGRELVGIAPLYVDEMHNWGQRWKCLRLVGDGSNDSDYLDWFAEPGQEKAVVDTFLRFLEAQRYAWDWLELNGARCESPIIAAILDWAGEKSWSLRSDLLPCATLRLPQSWDEYLRTLQPRFRTKVRSSMAATQDCLRSTPIDCGSREDLKTWLPLFFDLHTCRWGTKSKPGVFRDSAKRKFYRDLSAMALEREWLAFSRLNWGERALAFQYGLVYKKRFHLLQEAYDPGFAMLRPGVALRACLMRRWIEAGLEEYDFLAGFARYKSDWGATEKLTRRVRVAAKYTSVVTGLEWPQVRGRIWEGFGRVTPKILVRARRRILAKRAEDRWQSTNGQGGAHKMPRTLVRWLASRAYSCTPLAIVGRSVASRYSWEVSAPGVRFPLQRRLRPVCQIFLYHRVNDEGDPFLGGLPVTTFAAQMEYIARNFRVLTLDQISQGEFAGQPYSVAVTFDDGYRDNFVCAFPILKRLGIPATVFLATGCIESGELPWYDQVRLAFKLTMRTELSLNDRGGPQGSLEDLSCRLRLLKDTLAWLCTVSEVERPQAVQAVLCDLGVPSYLNLPKQMLGWDEIRQMSKSTVAFGAHTVSHPVLARLSEPEIKWQIVTSKQTIENRLQLPAAHFAYPFGKRSDFNAVAKRVVQDAGFTTALTTIRGLNDTENDRYELRRFNPWESDSALFRMKLDWYRFREHGDEGSNSLEAIAAAV